MLVEVWKVLLQPSQNTYSHQEEYSANDKVVSSTDDSECFQFIIDLVKGMPAHVAVVNDLVQLDHGFDHKRTKDHNHTERGKVQGFDKLE